jgi:hypothetical protein
MKLKIINFFITSLLVSFLTGCGVTIGAKPVKVSSNGHVAGEGIVYALPKTTFEVQQPVTLIASSGGVLTEIWDDCKRACDSIASENEINASCEIDNKPKLKLGIPLLKSRAIPDTSHLYQVSTDADLFQNLSMKFEVDEGGVLKSADNSASNLTYEVISTIVKNAIPLISKVLDNNIDAEDKGTQSTESYKPNLSNCYQAAKSVEKISKLSAEKLKGSEKYMCNVIKKIDACVKEDTKKFTEGLVKENDQLTKLFNSVSLTKDDSKMLEQIASYRREQINTAKAKFTEVEVKAKNTYGLGETKNIEATYLLTIPLGSPDEFIDYTPSPVSLKEQIGLNTFTVLGTNDNSAKFSSLFFKTLEKLDDNSNITYEIEAKKPDYSVDIAHSTASLDSSEKYGYKYRIPIQSDVKFIVKNGSDEVSAGTNTQPRVIAQFGPIASLPSHFNGKGGKVMVRLLR